MRVSRQDFTGRFDASKRTPQGGLKLNAYATRTGVLIYNQPDGSTIRELRHPDDVFKPESMSSLSGAPVTIGHPGKVTTANINQHSVGHVGDTVERKDDKFLAATLRIQDAKAVEAVEKGNLIELSCGYDCDAIPEQGEFNGEKYDARQTNIVYNHVALLPKNGGRAGNDVRLRFDGYVLSDGAKLVPDTMTVEFEKKVADLTAEAADQRAKKETHKERADKAEKELAATKKALETLHGENAALEKRVQELQDPARFDAAVTARVRLHEDAREFGVEISGTERDIMVACVSKVDSSFRADGLSDDFIRGRFVAEARLTKAGKESLAKVRTDAAQAETAPEKNLVEEARKRQDEKSRNAWKGNKG